MKRVFFRELFLNLYDRPIITLFFSFLFIALCGGTQTGKCATCKSYNYCEGNGLHLRDEQTRELLCCHLEKLEL